MSKISELLGNQQLQQCNNEKSKQLKSKTDVFEDVKYTKQNCVDNEHCDMVNHPAHYQLDDMTYEPIKVIRAWNLNFNIGNAVKYLSRYNKKWNAVEDLKKAIFYIQDEINHLNNNTKKETK